MSVRDKNKVENFTRGGDVFSHKLNMFLQNVWRVVWKSIAIAILATGLSMWLFMSAAELSVFQYFIVARIETLLPGLDGLRWLARDVITDGVDFGTMRPWEIMKWWRHDLGPTIQDQILFKFFMSGIAGLVAGTLTAWYIARFYRHFGETAGEDEFRRGAQLAKIEELIEKIKTSDTGAGQYTFVGVPLPKGREMYNILATGAQGSGKSVALLDLCEQVCAAGKKMIIYDKTGEFTEYFYRPGKDIILNPFDERFGKCSFEDAGGWNIFSELSFIYDFERISHSLIPDPAEPNATSQYFASGARAVFYCALKKLYEEGRRTTNALAEVLLTFTQNQMADFLAGTPAASYIAKGAGEQAAGVMSTIVGAVSVLQHVRTGSFSISEWVKRDDDSRLFINSDSSIHSIVRPLISMMLDITIRATMELPKTREDRLWIFLDELASLNQLSILRESLTETRKFGVVHVCGLQDIPQLVNNFGENVSKTLKSNLQTYLVLAVTDESTAKAYSERLGDQELDEQAEGVSFGAASSRDGSNVQTSRRDKDIVKKGEILTLDACTGFLKVAGPYPVAKVDFKNIMESHKATWKQKQPGFIKRKDLCLATAVPAATPAPVSIVKDEPKAKPSPGRELL